MIADFGRKQTIPATYDDALLVNKSQYRSKMVAISGATVHKDESRYEIEQDGTKKKLHGIDDDCMQSTLFHPIYSLSLTSQAFLHIHGTVPLMRASRVNERAVQCYARHISQLSPSPPLMVVFTIRKRGYSPTAQVPKVGPPHL